MSDKNITTENHEAEILKKRNLLQKRFYTALVTILTLSIIFCVLTFFCNNPIKLIFGISSVVLNISFFIVWAIKKSKIKKTYTNEK